MEQLVEDILQVLTKYFVYLYPGFISLGVYDFLRGIEFKETKESLIKSIVISFCYVDILLPLINAGLDASVYQVITKYSASQGYNDNAILFFISIILPFLWWRLQNKKDVKSILKALGINTNIHDNPLDIVTSLEDGAWISVFMDDMGVMYEGSLRNYVSELERAQYLMISDYIISKIDKERNEYVQTFPKEDESNEDAGENQACETISSNGVVNKSKEWVILDRSKITRIEVLFDEKH